MDARLLRAVLATALYLLFAGVSYAATVRTPNFVIETADPDLARQSGEAAERYRHDLAIEWTGAAMPNWSAPCPIKIQAAEKLGAGGATTFAFDRGEVFGWVMSIQGSRERILDSVLPHEITHMIFATHFRQPLPRWADEGGATTVEHVSERSKQRVMLDTFLRTNRGLAFARLFAMKEYPSDILPLYAEGYSLAEFLIQQGGRRKYVEFIGDGLKSNDWAGAVSRHYGFADLGKLQNSWLAWVKQGMPNLAPQQQNPSPNAPDIMLASWNPPRPSSASTMQNASSATPATNAPSMMPSMSARTPVRPSVYERTTSMPSSSTTEIAPVQNKQPGVTIALPSRNSTATSAEMSEDNVVLAGPMVPVVQQPTATEVTTEVARPQPLERPGQIILEWNAR